MRVLKAILIIFAVLLACVLVLVGVLAFWLFHVDTETSYDIEHWEEAQSWHDYLPSVDEIGVFEKVYSKYYQRRQFFFISGAYTLKASYSEDEFEEQKKQIDEKYNFTHSVRMYDDNGETSTEKPTSFVLDGFSFRMVQPNTNIYHDFPKRIFFIGISENTREIAYIYFSDSDIDYLTGTLEEFLVEYCDWNVNE